MRGIIIGAGPEIITLHELKGMPLENQYQVVNYLH